jgi:hypothetical protein
MSQDSLFNSQLIATFILKRIKQNKLILFVKYNLHNVIYKLF